MSIAKEGAPCSICFRPRLLLLRVGLLDYCADCWRAAGEPRPPAPSRIEVAAATARIHERMNKKGGDVRHLVRSGQA